MLCPDVSAKGVTCDASDCDRVPFVRPRDPTATRYMIERWRQSLPPAKEDGAQDAESSSSHGTLHVSDLWGDSSEEALTESSDDCTEVGDTKGHWLTHA